MLIILHSFNHCLVLLNNPVIANKLHKIRSILWSYLIIRKNLFKKSPENMNYFLLRFYIIKVIVAYDFWYFCDYRAIEVLEIQFHLHRSQGGLIVLTWSCCEL